jgi:RNA polymerase sigma-70 factor, ECF subfamily
MSETAQALVDLIERIAAGDRDAFQHLYRATSSKLYGIIFRIVRNKSTADELLQEVYVKVWQRSAAFDDSRASPITWMATIARNRAIDEIRRAHPQDGLELTEAAEAPAESVDPLEGRARSEALQALLRCLRTLPDERRDVILLAYCRGLSRDALATRFGRPVPTIKTWLHRGLAQLKSCLST